MAEFVLTPEQRKKGKDRMHLKQILRKRYSIPPLSKAVRKKCLECVCMSAHEVRICAISECPIWPYRFGHNPDEDDLRVPVFSKIGDLEGYQEYEGYPTDSGGSGE